MFVFIIASNLIGLWNSRNIAADLNKIISRDFEVNLAANNIIDQLNKQNIDSYKALAGTSSLVELNSNIKETNKIIEENILKLENLLQESKSIEVIKELKVINEKMNLAFNRFSSTLANSGYDQAKFIFISEYEPEIDKSRKIINNIIKISVDNLKHDTKMAEESNINSNIIVFSILFVLVFISLIIIFWLSKTIIKPINLVVDAAKKLSEGNLNFNLEANTKDETADLMIAINKVKTDVSNIIFELKDVAQSISNGKLDKRSDTSKYKGAFADLSAEYNTSLDSVIKPLNVTAEYIDRLSKGDIPSKITEDYRGDFNEIKSNLNSMIDTFESFVNELDKYYQMQNKGEIDYFMNENFFTGVYKQMAIGANEIAKLHIKNILDILNLLKEYAEGDLSNNLRILPGKQIIANERLELLKNNLNKVIIAIRKASDEQAAGDIEANIDTNDFTGIYKDVCIGFNSCVNKIHSSVAKILNTTIKYAEGDFDVVMETLPGKQIIGNHALDKLRDNVLNVIEAIRSTAKAQADGDIEANININNFNGAYRDVCEGFNSCVNQIHSSVGKILNTTIKYAQGDLSVVMDKLPGKQIIGNQALDLLRNNLIMVNDEIDKLVSAAQKGNLSLRADDSKLTGTYKNIISGLNLTLDNIIKPLNVSAEYIDRIAHGDIPELIIDEYNGDFNEIKNNINYLINTLNSLNNQTNILINSIIAGNLNTQGDDSGFSGTWKELINSMNRMLNEINLPMTELNNILLKISENDYSEKPNINGDGIWKELSYAANEVINRLTFVQNLAINISNGDLSLLHDLKTSPQRSQNDKLRPAFISMMESIKNLLDDTNLLVESIKIGMLNNRMQTNHHSGEFAAVAQGINNVVDVLINNLNTALDFLTLVSNGDELEILDVDKFEGEFKKVPNTINKLRNFLYAMIEDTQSAANAAINGNLNQRIDLSKYPGGWNVIVKGFNDSIDAMVEQFKIALEFLEKVSNGDELVIYDDARYRGDFRRMINNINKLRNFLYTMIDDTQSTANLTSAGDLSKRIDLSKYPGGWGIITGGINATLDGIIVPLENAIETLEVFATGDMTAIMKGDYKGDHKRLQDAINKLSSSLGDLIRQVHTGVTDTAAATLQISETTDKMAAATQEQSAQTEEIASAVEQMSRTINENAQNAVRTSELSRKSGEIAEEGKLVVEQTINKMRDIAGVVHQSASNIERLGESSKQIGEIISVIDDIADQTNLLALNAAIEAARAGEQGRGFAVVADEVRKLAERTTEATKQIADMIQGIQKETETAVKVMKEGNTEVEQGITLADEAGNALNMILNSAKDVISMITQIASASEEQAATSEQLTQNVVTINNTTAENAAQLHDIASATDGLTNLTEKLRDLVEQFKVDTEVITDKHSLSSKERIKQLLVHN